MEHTENLIDFLRRGFLIAVGGMIFALGSNVTEADDAFCILAASMILWALVEVIRHFDKKHPKSVKDEDIETWW